MGFTSFNKNSKVAAGFKPDGDSEFPLIESCDIQVTEDGKRLDQCLPDGLTIEAKNGDNLLFLMQGTKKLGEGVSLPQGVGNVGLETVYDADGNKYIYLTVNGKRVGNGVLLPQGGGENLSGEIVEQYSLVEQIEDALQEKANNTGTIVPIVDIEGPVSDGRVDTYTIYFADETTKTLTVTNGKSAYEYAQEAGYTGTEDEFAEKLADTGIIGSWTFKDKPSLTTLPDRINEIAFVSNGKEYNAIGWSIDSFTGIHNMTYSTDSISETTYAYNPNGDYDISHMWLDEAFKTVTIIREPSDPLMVTWIKANAEKVGAQSKSDERLKTKNKRIVEAINELNDKIDAGGGTSENALLNISVTTDYPTTMSAIITAIEEAGGDVAKVNFITFTGYLSRFVAIKFNHYGDNTYQVECVDINNVTKIYNPENNNVIDVTATRIVDFLSYTVNDALQTDDKTIVGAINEVKAKVDALNNSGSDTDSIVGTWTFNDTIEPLPAGEYELQFSVTAYQTYNCIRYGVLGPPVYVLWYGNYDNSEFHTTYCFENEASYGLIPGWQDESYKTINITEEPTDENLITWLRANAVKWVDDTEDAANENVLLNVSVETDYPTTLAHIIHSIENAGGDTSKPTFVKLVGYQNGQFLMRFNHFGENTYQISCSDPFTGTVFDDGRGNVYDVTATRIKDFLDAGRPAARLPNIRFANFTKVENEDSGDMIYRFTVENMGGGTLQEGDKLQICCRRTFPNGKWKLRKMAEREITYDDDIGKRFLKIEVNPDDERNHNWLFRNDRVGGGTKSSMYFRLKRVTKTVWTSNDEEIECNAIFSNVEEVKKTYILVDGQPDPYSLRIK